MTTMRTEKEAPAFIACSFSAGLDDLPPRLQSDVVAVLRVLERTGRYSAFEASDNMTIARMMTRLHHKGCSIVRNGVRTDYGRLIETDEARSAYPWTYIRLTDAGRRLLADAAEEAKQ